ncbi:BgMFREP19.1 [Biomphalaria glabrata]
MARLFLLFILCVFVVSLAGSELVIDVQPNVISPEITPQLVINCSITNNEVQQLDLIKSLTLSRYNETIREFDDLIALDSLTLNLKQFVRFKYSQISFGNLYITLTLPNPTQFDARIYKCNATGANSDGTNISLFAKKAVEYETNSTALIEEIRRIKKDENYCSFKKDDLADIKQKANGFIATISKDQPVVTTNQDVNLLAVKGKLHDDSSKNSNLQVTWTNPKFSESGKYFCGAHINNAQGRNEHWNEMLTITVERLQFDDIVKVIIENVRRDVTTNQESINGIKDELLSNKQNIVNNKKEEHTTRANISGIQEELLRNQQNIVNNKKDINTTQDSIRDIQEELLRNQQNIENVKEELQSKQDSMKSIQDELLSNLHNTNISSIWTVLSNVSTAVMDMKDDIDKGKTDIKQIKSLITKLHHRSCRDVNSTDDRVVVTLASGLKVMCDTKTDGGGWIIFQRRINGNVDFYRGWKEYRDGFGDYNIGEFYLGNENIYMLTSTGQYNLRIDLKYENKAFFAQYSSFKILSEKEKYKLNIGVYSGNAGDSFSRHNNSFFSTFDRDNDEHSSNCAVSYTGAWWYHSPCHSCNLNGKWGSSVHGKGVIWYKLSRFDSSVSFTEMKIREIL